MKKEKPFRVGLLLMAIMFFAAVAVIPYAHEASARNADQCAELLASYKRLDAKAEGASLAELKQLWPQVEKVVRSMRSLGCPNTPDVPISGSQPGQSGQSGDRPTHVPETEDSAAYTESPESRHLNWRGFLEKMQPPDSEAPGPCGDLSGRWQITTSEGSETWEIWHTEVAPRLYGGRKASGGDHARMLAALLDGNILKLKFDSYNDEQEVTGGTYTCKLTAGCRASLSECNLTYDRNRRGSFDATFKWLGSRPQN